MKKYFAIITLISVLIMMLNVCSLEPDVLPGASSDGIVIYSGREILNEKYWEIVTGRVQQLRATGPSGHIIYWQSSDPRSIDISQTGMLRAGTSPNKEVVITASSVTDPTISAKVTFKTKGLR